MVFELGLIGGLITDVDIVGFFPEEVVGLYAVYAHVMPDSLFQVIFSLFPIKVPLVYAGVRGRGYFESGFLGPSHMVHSH